MRNEPAIFKLKNRPDSASPAMQCCLLDTVNRPRVSDVDPVKSTLTRGRLRGEDHFSSFLANGWYGPGLKANVHNCTVLKIFWAGWGISRGTNQDRKPWDKEGMQGLGYDQTWRWSAVSGRKAWSWLVGRDRA